MLFRSGWRVLPFDFQKFEQLYDLRMVLETTAVHRLCTEPKRADQAVLLLRTHIQTSRAEVRKITLHQVHMARAHAEPATRG